MNGEINKSKEFAKAASLCGWSLLTYYALNNLFQIVGLIIYSVVTKTPFENIHQNTELIIGVLCMLLALVLTFFVLYGRKLLTAIRGKWFFDNRTVTAVKLGLPLVCAASVAGSALYGLALTFAEESGFTYNTEILEIRYEGIGLWVDMLYSCLLAPFFEELVYRGFIMGTLMPYGKKTAVIASAVAFAVMHGIFVQMPLAFFAGLALGAVAVYSKSLVPSFIIHMLYNTFAKCGDFIAEDNLKGNAMFSSVLLTLALAGSIIFLFQYRKFRPLWQEEGTKGRLLQFATKAGFIIFFLINMLTACTFVAKL